MCPIRNRDFAAVCINPTFIDERRIGIQNKIASVDSGAVFVGERIALSDTNAVSLNGTLIQIFSVGTRAVEDQITPDIGCAFRRRPTEFSSVCTPH